MKLIDLNANVRNQSVVADLSVLGRAVNLDRALNQWAATNLVPQWAYSRVSVPQNFATALMFLDQDSCDLYPDAESCSFWNKYRCARITVNKLILVVVQRISIEPWGDVLAVIDYRPDAIIHQMAGDVLASVPYSLGLVARDNDNVLRFCGPDQMHALRGLELVMKLFLSGSSDIPDELRGKIIQCLGFIGHVFGIALSCSLADVLRGTGSPLAHLL